jgi:transcriptional regulator GlxA family with amidase domain
MRLSSGMAKSIQGDTEAAVHVLGFPGAEELDLVGPYECFQTWHTQAAGWPCRVVALSDAPFTGAKGLTITPHSRLDATSIPNILVIPGGEGSRSVARSEAVLNRIRMCLDRGGTVASVCTGVRVLHAAGVLQGRTVSTHHSAHDEVRSWPNVQLAQKRVTRDGPVWTAAGVSSGLDLALALVEAKGGPSDRQIVSRYVEYPPDSDTASPPPERTHV